MKLIQKIGFLFILVIISLSISSCDKRDTITINYEQYAACKEYSYDIPGSGNPTETTHTEQATGAFVIFKITSIDNTQPNAIDYNFG